MNEDENLAAPKHAILAQGEKILCEFELVHTVHKEVSFDTAFIARDKGFDVGVFWFAMTAGCAFLFCLFARQSVKTALFCKAKANQSVNLGVLRSLPLRSRKPNLTYNLTQNAESTAFLPP